MWSEGAPSTEDVPRLRYGKFVLITKSGLGVLYMSIKGVTQDAPPLWGLCQQPVLP
jgi:hypothetical protein